MRNPIRALLERDEQRWQTHGVKQWERWRTQGKLRFVLKFGLLSGFILVSALNLLEYLLDGRIRVETLWSQLLTYLIFGFVGISVVWRRSEKKYQKYLTEELEKKIGRFSRR